MAADGGRPVVPALRDWRLGADERVRVGTRREKRYDGKRDELLLDFFYFVFRARVVCRRRHGSSGGQKFFPK